MLAGSRWWRLIALVAFVAAAPLLGATRAMAERGAAPVLATDPCLSPASIEILLSCKPGGDATLHPLGSGYGRHGQQIDYAFTALTLASWQRAVAQPEPPTRLEALFTSSTAPAGMSSSPVAPAALPAARSPGPRQRQ